MATKLDLADAQFIGFHHGKDHGLIAMVASMGLTEKEWIKWKSDYPTYPLTEIDIQEIDEYFDARLLSFLLGKMKEVLL